MQCPGCDNEVEAHAVQCELCGFPLQEARMAPMRLYVIGAALLSSLAVYAALVFIIPAGKPPEGGFLRIFEYLLAGVAAVIVGVLGMWPEAPEVLAPQKAMTRLVMQCALAESVAIYGLLLHFMGAPKTHALAFMAVSAALLLWAISRVPRLAQAVRRYMAENHEAK